MTAGEEIQPPVENTQEKDQENTQNEEQSEILSTPESTMSIETTEPQVTLELNTSSSDFNMTTSSSSDSKIDSSKSSEPENWQSWLKQVRSHLESASHLMRNFPNISETYTSMYKAVSSLDLTITGINEFFPQLLELHKSECEAKKEALIQEKIKADEEMKAIEAELKEYQERLQKLQEEKQQKLEEKASVEQKLEAYSKL